MRLRSSARLSSGVLCFAALLIGCAATDSDVDDSDDALRRGKKARDRTSSGAATTPAPAPAPSGAGSLEGAVDVSDHGAIANADFLDPTSGVYYSDAARTVRATDTTDAINAAIDYAVAQKKNQVFIPPGTYLIRTVGERESYEFEQSSRGGIRMKSGLTLTLSPDTTLVMNPTAAGAYAFISIDNQHDVTIRGGKIVGDLDHHMGPRGVEPKHNYCYGINVANASSHVLIEGTELSRCTDDGIMIADYLSEQSGGKRAESLTIRNVNSHHNGRQGLSITSGSNILVEGNTFSHQTTYSPMSGIDIELESYDFVGVSNVSIINNTFAGNSFAGVIVSDMFNDVPGSLSRNIVMRGNTVEGVQLGLFTSGAVDGLDISNNQVRLTCTKSQLCAALASTSDLSKNVVISNNTVTSDDVLNYTIGVLSMGVSRNLITGNRLTNQDAGIALDGQNARVSGNTISRARTNPIWIWGGTHDIAGDNTIVPR